MITQVSIGTGNGAGTAAITMPAMPEPISFGFDEMIKAKAEADAEIRAEIERRLNERSGASYREVPRSSTPEDEVSENAVTYRYDVAAESNIPAELSEIKRRKNRR